jgi:ketosteroid isomerase-like protein
VDLADDPDILLATTRYRCMEEMGQPVHVVERMGVPLLYVFERHPRGRWTEPALLPSPSP